MGSFGVLSKLNTVGVYTLDYVRYVVLDEADALFHNTFEEKLRVFMGRLPVRTERNICEKSKHILKFVLTSHRLVCNNKWTKQDFLNWLNLF